MSSKQSFVERLQERRHLIGVVHLRPLPGSPRWAGDMGAVQDQAVIDALAYAKGGADAVLVENFGDVPFRRGRVEPWVVAAMTTAVQRVKSETEFAVGVSVLRNDALAGLGISVATGAEFIRVNVLCGAYATDQGIIEGVADELMRARRMLGGSTAILADVRVKHAAPIAERQVDIEVAELCSRGLADGLVVTGAATGVAPSPEMVLGVAREAGHVPVLVGSGVTPDVLRPITAAVRGALVATWTRVGGQVEPGRVGTLKEALAG